MIIAKAKRKTNIAEYILYMWQVEDLIRAYNFDIEKIKTEYISKFEVDEQLKAEIAEWYNNLLVGMIKEHIQTTGHLQFIKNLMNDLNEFHLKMIETNADGSYYELVHQAESSLSEFRIKAKSENISDVETCFNGLYQLILLRLQKKEINEATLSSIQRFGKLMGHLSARYLQFENDEFELP